MATGNSVEVLEFLLRSLLFYKFNGRTTKLIKMMNGILFLEKGVHVLYLPYSLTYYLLV